MQTLPVELTHATDPSTFTSDDPRREVRTTSKHGEATRIDLRKSFSRSGKDLKRALT